MSETDWEPPLRGQYEADARNDPRMPFETTDAPIHHFDPEPVIEQIPVPVYDVSPKDQPQIKDMTSQRFVIASDPVLITGARRERTRIVITNDGLKPVYIGTDPQIQADQASGAIGSHFKLPNPTATAPPSMIELFHNSQVWCRCAAGDTTTVNAIEEFTVDNEEPLDV